MRSSIVRRNQENSGFNFWPSFSDLCVAFILFWVLIVILALVTPAFSEGVIRRKILEQVKVAMDTNSPAEYEKYWTIDNDTGTIKLMDTKVLFSSGSADLSPQGEAVITALAQGLSGAFEEHSDNIEAIMIEGFADCEPISDHAKVKYPTNWELSTARASSVIRYILSVAEDRPGFAKKFCAAGYGSARAESQTTPLATDRRIEIRILTRSSSS